jgi:uncharacterized protein (DUF983 family)
MSAGADDRTHHPPVDPVRAGLAGCCPRCGEGQLFSGFLTLRDQCRNCGLDYAFADSGDGPAAFVILLVGFVVVGLALYVEVSHQPPLWLHFGIWVPLAVGLSLVAMRLAKGVLITLQYANKAAEGRLDGPK